MKKVTEKDLKGDIADFPIEVVQWMCEQQVKQGNEFNPKVFQQDRAKGQFHGGISWINEKYSYFFYEQVIISKDFDLFFERHPKKKQQPKQKKVRVYIKQIEAAKYLLDQHFHAPKEAKKALIKAAINELEELI